MSLEWVRDFVSEGGVFAVGVVVAFDVIEDFYAGIAGVLETTLLEYFEFERSAKAFGQGVGVGVGAGGHARAETGFGQSHAEGGAAILAAAIAREDGVVGGARPQGLI